MIKKQLKGIRIYYFKHMSNKFILSQYKLLYNKVAKDIIHCKNVNNCDNLIYIKNGINKLVSTDKTILNKRMKELEVFECDIFYCVISKIKKNFKLDNYKTEIYRLNDSKKRKRNEQFDNATIDNATIDNATWVSASRVRNYLLKDPIIDWLQESASKRTKITNNSFRTNGFEAGSFTTFIQNKGTEFEEAIITILKKKFKKDIVTIANSYTDSWSTLKYNETIEAMNKGIPLIYQGVLHNHDNDTYGMPDLIVRSDYLNKLVEENAISFEDSSIKGLHPKYHYRIVDIKMHSLNLTADGKHILNSGSIPAFKGQLHIYNEALAKIQNYLPPCAYILGKSWSYTSCKTKYENNDCFNKLGVIDYVNFDNKYTRLTSSAIDWIKNVRTNGHKWTTLEPSVPELYPNMSNMMDGQWHNVKQDIAESIGEITQIWNCGVENREIAHDKGIYSWKDKRCNAKNMGFRGKINGPIVDAILKINKGKKKITMNIKNNNDNWQTKDKLELFVDFETISSICTDFKCSKDNVKNDGFNMIFMIGLGYEQNGKWKFVSFIANTNTINEEKKILMQFYKYVTKLKNEFNMLEYPKMFHWGHAEKTLFNSVIRRHGEKDWEKLRWSDMLKVFMDEPIVVKGSLKFGLKNIAKAMFNHRFIKTTWNNNNKCANGQNAMIYAYNEYKKCKGTGIKKNDIILDIAEYNEIDCKVIYEIIGYLRNNCL